jgi:ABC-type transport system substrate-binding protein
MQFLSDDIEYLAPNFDSPPFNNIHCRLALAYAIDQNAINNEVLHHAQLPLYGAVPQGVPGYYAAPDAPHYNPARAREELKQCPGGIHNVQLVYFHGSTDLDNEFAAMQNMFAQVGIGISIKALTFNDWLTIVDQPLYKTHTTLSYDNWFGAFPDPEQWLNILFRAGSVQNVSDFNNPTYNRLVDEADITFNPAWRAQLYIRAQKVLLSQVGVIPFGQPVEHAMVKPWVHGLIGTPFLGSQGLAARNNNWANVSVSPH